MLLSACQKLFSRLLLALVLASSAHAVSIIPTSTVIPDSEVLLNFGGTGLDWVYAGPIAPDEFGPGNIEGPSYRAGEGWRFATAAEWLLRPDWTDFIKPGYTQYTASGSNHASYRYTSEYWSFFSHVDLSDAASGFITNGLDIGQLDGVWETWYVRNSAAGVPDAASSVLLLSGALIALGAWGRRRR